jgi:hypothetical protein
MLKLVLTEDQEKLRKEIWREVELKIKGRISPGKRRLIENDVTRVPDMDVWLTDLEDSVFSKLVEMEVLALYRKARPRDTSAMGKKGKKGRGPYTKCFDSRLHLVEFVAGRVLGLSNLEERSFTPKHRGAFDWPVLAKAWNTTHPGDAYTADYLKREYYRCIRPPEMREAYFDRLESEIRSNSLLMSIYPFVVDYERLKSQGRSSDAIAAILNENFPRTAQRCYRCNRVKAKGDGLCAKCHANLLVSHEPSWLLPGDRTNEGD